MTRFPVTLQQHKMTVPVLVLKRLRIVHRKARPAKNTCFQSGKLVNQNLNGETGIRGPVTQVIDDGMHETSCSDSCGTECMTDLNLLTSIIILVYRELLPSPSRSTQWLDPPASRTGRAF